MTQANSVLSTPPTNTPIAGTFQHVCSLERPLTGIRNFLNALLIITEALEEPAGSAINEMTWAMVTQVEEVQQEYVTLFRLSHPDRERFEREGWPSNHWEVA